MEHDNLVHGLLRKRAEIAGQIEATLRSAEALRVDLAHVDATIRMFRPGLDLTGVKVKPVNGKHPAKSGEMLHPIVGILRTATGPMTTREIAERIIAHRGLPADDAAFVTTMARRTASAMLSLKRRGLAKGEKGEGSEMLWSRVQV